MKKNNLFFLICFFGILNAPSAQLFTNYTNVDGLIDNSVNCISIDANNNVWLGTQNGVSKFDGSSWTNYNASMDTGFIDNSINAICATSNGFVWIGTDFGASVFDGTSWTSFTTSNGLGDNRINHIAEKSDGTIWFGDYDGLTILNPSPTYSWTSYTMNDGLPFGGINYTAFDSNGDAWLGSGLGGLIKFDGSAFEIFNQNNGIINNKVRSVLIDGQDNKWVGTAEGLTVLNSSNAFVANHTKMLILSPPDTLNPVEDLAIDSQGNIWTGIYVDYLVTEGGVAVYDGNFWADFDVSHGLVGPVVRALDVDGNDNVWVATSTGVSKISNTPVAINEINANLNIYPNPSNNGLYYLSLSKNFTNTVLKVNNIEGKTILIKNNVFDGITEINLQNSENGIYFIDVLTNKNQILRKKIIKK